MKGVIRRILGRAQTTIKNAAKPLCWACSLNKCGQMFDNTCTCCRTHPYS